MILYHGGNLAVWPRIAKQGLKPRRLSRAKDNWKHTVTSNRNAVYLTNAYAWHFAAMHENGFIVEVDTDCLYPYLLCPDEDWMEQATRGKGPDNPDSLLAPAEWDMKRRTKHYRRIARDFPHLASDSLAGLGTAGYYDTIHPGAFTRVTFLRWGEMNPHWRMMASDSMVSTINYKILQERHKAFTRFLMGEEAKPEEFDVLMSRDLSEEMEEMRKMAEDRRERWVCALADRSGMLHVGC